MKLDRDSLVQLKDLILGEKNITPQKSKTEIQKFFNSVTIPPQNERIIFNKSKRDYALARLNQINDDELSNVLVKKLWSNNFLTCGTTKIVFDKLPVVNRLNIILEDDEYKIVSKHGKFEIGEIDDQIEDVKLSDPAFENPEALILEYLDKAQFLVLVVVAWFTKRNIFYKILELAHRGVIVEVIIDDNEANDNYGVNWKDYPFVYKMKKLDAEMNKYMIHNKICIIDLEHVGTGSANWSKNAQKQGENWQFATSKTNAFKYLNHFKELKASYYQQNNHH